MTEAEFVQLALSSTETRLHRVLNTIEQPVDDWIHDNWEWLKNYISNVRTADGQARPPINFDIMQFAWGAFAGDPYYNLLKEMLLDAT